MASELKVLGGHTSPETAYVVEDWPYGRTLRCKKRFWVETATKGAKKGEQRIVSQTTNPKVTTREVWNKPKGGTYSPVAVFYVGEDGLMAFDGLSWYADEDKILAFAERYAPAIGEHETKQLNVLLALARASKRITWEVVKAPSTPEEVAERAAKQEEVSAGVRRLVAYEHAKIVAGGGVAKVGAEGLL